MESSDRRNWREGKVTSIGEIMDRNIILKGADVLTVKGFTQVPNHVLVSSKLSPGAKLTYAMLLKYAWQNDCCFPGQERLATDMGVTRQSTNSYVQELKREQFISIKRRGQGRPNLYELNLTATSQKYKRR
jgi:biotin operon repressor